MTNEEHGLRPSTLPRYLIGSREAILHVAASPWSFWVGMILVFSAGLAREYDGEDLVHEPWHAFRPLAASLVSGTTLFLIVHLAALITSGEGSGKPPSFFKAWRMFLGLFWFTAPMAWLYAVPYERFMTPVDAISVNLWTLALVSVWRVVLITRVISVVYGIGSGPAFFLVMFFADAVVFAVVSLVPTPVIDVMGGIRHTARDALIADVTLTLTFLSVLSAPIWILGALVSICVLIPKWQDFSSRAISVKPRKLLMVASMSVVAFIPLLVWSQPEQINQREAEQLLTTGRVTQALKIMSQHARDDYPPHWNPPPRIGYRETIPDLNEVQSAMLEEWPAEWVASLYVAKIERGLKNDLMPYWNMREWKDVADFVRERGDYIEHDESHISTLNFILENQQALIDSDRSALEEILILLTPEQDD